MMRSTTNPFRDAPGIGSMLVLVLLVLLVLPQTAAADLVRDAKPLGEGQPRPVFARIEAAWEAGDIDALAALVHPDGLRVRGGAGFRSTSYSPNQAFYYFKNLFQSGRTLAFDFQRKQDAKGPRAHAMAVWRFQRGGSDREQESRLVLVLERVGKTWRLAEINTVR